MSKIMKRKKKFYFILILIVILGIAGFLFWKLGNRSVEIGNSGENNEKESENNYGISPISGLQCENYNRRPIAVMMAEDPVTRPLSGISQADMVIEMPVITGSITRMMAVFQCESPDEIGSVRSARHDFIPLAMGLDAIFAHWGGSHFALDKLDNGIMNNIDAMHDFFNTYYRKSDKPMPHNGFTSMDKLISAAEKFNYRLENKFEGYPHKENSKFEIRNSKLNGKLTIGYSGHYEVYYEYSPQTNAYLRWRAGEKEMDKNNNQQAEVSVVIAMRAASRMIEPPDYNDVDIEGEGEAIISQNGEQIKGSWRKEGSYSNSKLYFLDNKGKEIEFTPGKIWLEIVEPTTEIKWETF